jgi:hypothetical protein
MALDLHAGLQRHQLQRPEHDLAEMANGGHQRLSPLGGLATQSHALSQQHRPTGTGLERRFTTALQAASETARLS